MSHLRVNKSPVASHTYWTEDECDWLAAYMAETWVKETAAAAPAAAGSRPRHDWAATFRAFEKKFFHVRSAEALKLKANQLRQQQLRERMAERLAERERRSIAAPGAGHGARGARGHGGRGARASRDRQWLLCVMNTGSMCWQ